MTALPIPAKYEFDDTPKAFKRMLQRKNGNEDEYRKLKHGGDANRKLENRQEKSSFVAKPKNFDLTTNPNTKFLTKVQVQANTKTTNTFASSNTIRAKRKAHLQSRDLKKKLKRHSSSLEYTNANTPGTNPTAFRRDVRDVVQEPPKLHRPRKTFKKVRDSNEEVKSWSEDDELAEEDEE